MAFLTFISFVLIVFPITLLVPNTRFIRTTASIIFTLGLMLLVLDTFIYSRLGYHLNASSSSQIIDVIISEIKDDSKMFASLFLMLFMVILTFELTISNYAWKHLKQLQKTTFARPIIVGLVAAFFFSHITHIWADATVNYDILRQDTVLPLSYPLTAKTLLTKYEMFNLEDYNERRTSPLSFTKNIPPYPQLGSEQCQQDNNNNQSVFIILTDDLLTQKHQTQFANRSNSASLRLNHHIDSALQENSWFNLLFSLPTIYQQSVLTQQIKPLLFQAIAQQNLARSFTVIGRQENNDEATFWFEHLFENKTQLADISSLVFADKLNNINQGLHLIYFPKNNQYQFELYMDALLLAQKQKTQPDIIWVSSIGNRDFDTSLTIKPALLIYPEANSKNITSITSHMDLQPTLMKNWLSCSLTDINTTNAYSNGADLLTLNQDRVIANTMQSGIMVFNKDKSVFIDQNGNFESYSRQLAAPIVENSDFPLMIDGVNFIKKFSQASAQ
jgi:membrane-anchored protein YejM (alkaline phosphatase superfamily)